MITVASLHDKAHWKGEVYRTSIGSGNGIDEYKPLPILYPTWAMVLDYKHQIITDKEYTDIYRELLASRKDKIEAWLKSLAPDKDITLLCHCPHGAKFCHRYLLARWIAKWRPDIEVIVR